MSDIMLTGVLRMPYEMAMASEVSRAQFWQRAQQAMDRIEIMGAGLVVGCDPANQAQIQAAPMAEAAMTDPQIRGYAVTAGVPRQRRRLLVL